MNRAAEPSRERDLFEQALDLATPAERDAFLATACGGDAPLLQRVSALLQADEATAAFLPEVPRTPLADISGVDADAPGAIIGRYRLLERIGEGGFGIVYMAEQREPVRRRVALKLIKPGMDSRQVIGRFEAERQALALMEHPNIAQIFDAGTTEGRARHSVRAGAEPSESGAPGTDAPYLSHGRPYFVMELVNGIPITKFCAERQLGLEARLRLFLDVCSAVQHAHQKGVIHRDLKPSNILVTLHGERPVPKVIDFGIAKALGEPLTDKTVFTQFHQLLGTPAYMSPEQAALSGLDLDTRSDIYSLGVLLYELLTGGPPFNSQELLGSGLDGLRRTICEREPERPSTRLRRTPAEADGRRLNSGRQRLEENQASASSRLLREVKGDLDWIVLKALEKDRERRYATANGLAADLRRFLDHEPVTAVAPTLRYQLAKLYRRNRKTVTTALAFAGLLLAASGVSTTLAFRAHQAEVRALREAATAQSVADFLWKELLKPLTPWSHTNPGVTLRGAFEAAADRIPARLVDEPLAEAAVRLAFARAHLGQAEWEAAETNLLRALALRRAHAVPPDLPTADVLFQLGTLREFQGRWAEAEAAFAAAAALRAQTLGAGHRDAVTAGAKAALNRARDLPPAEAEPLLRAAVEEVRRAAGLEHHVARAALNQLGMLCLNGGRLAEAGALFAQTLALAAAEEGATSHGALWSLGMLAVTRAQEGRWAEAEEFFDEVIGKRERFTGAAHPFTLQARLQRVEHLLLPLRRPAEAVAELRQLQAAAPTGLPASQVAPVLAAALAAWAAEGGGPPPEVFGREPQAGSGP